MSDAEKFLSTWLCTAKAKRSQRGCRLFFLLFVALAVNTAPVLGDSGDAKPIRIRLLSLFEPQQLNVRIASGAQAVLKIGRLTDLSVSAGDSIRIRKTNDQLNIAVLDSSGRVKTSTLSSEAAITPIDSTTFELRIPTKINRIVHGNLFISAQNNRSRNSLSLVLTTPLESLVASVIAGEMSGERSLEAFKVLAVTARSFIVSHESRHREEGFDFCDTTHCQVYRGEDDLMAQAAAPILQAVTETAGEMLTFKGRVIESYYTAVCGGLSAAPETVWGGRTESGYPYRPIACEWCKASPYRKWKRQAEVAPTLAALSSATEFKLSPLTELLVTRQNDSGVVQVVTIKDRARQIVLGTEEFRRVIGRRIGWNRVLSPTFRIERRGNFFIFRGSGFGSQVGLCVAGAIAQARAGRSYREILEFYFPQTERSVKKSSHLVNYRVQDSGIKIQQVHLNQTTDSRQPTTGNSWLPAACCLLPTFAFGIGRKLAELGEWLMAYGALGLFGIALLDSALIPLPSGPDLVMIALSANNHAQMPFYALAATVGSTIGCTILYLLARRGGAAALGRIKPEKRERIENLLGRYDMLAVMLPAVLPPPFPFKPFILSAGVFKLKIERFVLAIFIGRAVRFLIEGWLAIQFGDEAWNLIKRHGVKVLLVVAAIILVFLAVKFYKGKGRPPSLAVDEATPQD